MSQVFVFRIITVYIAGLFIAFSLYWLYSNVLLHMKYVDLHKRIAYTHFIINTVEVCLVTTLFFYSILLMIGTFKKCTEKIKPWLKVVAWEVLYYTIATPVVKDIIPDLYNLLIVFVSWFIVYIHYHLQKLKNSSQNELISHIAVPSSDDIHELLITNDLPPAYNTLKHFVETPPPSYISTMSDNHGPFLAVSY